MGIVDNERRTALSAKAAEFCPRMHSSGLPTTAEIFCGNFSASTGDTVLVGMNFFDGSFAAVLTKPCGRKFTYPVTSAADGFWWCGNARLVSSSPMELQWIFPSKQTSTWTRQLLLGCPFTKQVPIKAQPAVCESTNLVCDAPAEWKAQSTADLSVLSRAPWRTKDTNALHALSADADGVLPRPPSEASTGASVSSSVRSADKDEGSDDGSEASGLLKQPRWADISDDDDDDFPPMVQTLKADSENRAIETSVGRTNANSLSALGSAAMPTRGSLNHGSGQCKPCAFFWKEAGCGNGVECPFCHLCGAEEKKRRHKEKKAMMKARSQRP